MIFIIFNVSIKIKGSDQMKYALDKNNQAVSIENANKGESYFCLDKNCKAKLTACALDSVNVDSYFAARSKGKKHKDNCTYRYVGKVVNYEKDKINMDDFFKNLVKSTKKITNISKYNEKITIKQNTIKLPSNLKKMYDYLMPLGLEDKISNYKVSEILVCGKTNHIYKEYINGFKIVEAQLDSIDVLGKKLRFIFNKKNVSKCIYIDAILENYKIKENSYKIGEYYLIGSNFYTPKATTENSSGITIFRVCKTTINNVRKQIYKLEKKL